MTIESAAEHAAFSIGRLDAALDGHPLRPAWEHRTRLAAAVTASNWDGRGVDAGRLAGLMAGVPHPPLVDWMAEDHALSFLVFLAGLTGADKPPPGPPPRTEKEIAAEKSERAVMRALRGDLRLFEQALAASKAPSTLLAIGDVAWSMRAERDVLPGILQAAIPVALHKRAATRIRAIPGLAAFPARLERPEWKERFFLDLAAAAEDGVSRLHGLTLTFLEWRSRLGKRRSNSRLSHVLAAALCRPVLTPTGVSEMFRSIATGPDGKTGMSIPGATKLLAELQSEGILTEGTDRRRNHRLFIAMDLGVERHERPKRRRSVARLSAPSAVKPPKVPSPPPAPKRTHSPSPGGLSLAEDKLAALLAEVSPIFDRTDLTLAKRGFAPLAPLEEMEIREVEEEPADEPLAFAD